MGKNIIKLIIKKIKIVIILDIKNLYINKKFIFNKFVKKSSL